jgi:tetratricopeptide (TPR) repeat protein
MLVAALAAGCYLNSLGGPFLYDDLKDIADNPVLVDQGRLAEVFNTSFLHQGRERGLYRPVTGFSYWVDHRLFGPEPFWFHLESVLWHAAASIALLLLLRRLWPEEPLLALLGAGLFAVHPVHTEAVSWISGRSEVLATFWGLVAILAHLQADRDTSGAALFRAAALAAWLVAVGAKEMAATVPALLLLTDALLDRPQGWASPGRLAARYGPYVLGASAYLALRWRVLGGFGPVGAHQYFHGAPLSERGPTMLKVAASYVGRLVFPVNLNVAWSVTHARGMTDGPLPLLALALLAGLFYLAWTLRKKAPPVAWGIFWTMIALIPVSNFLPVGEVAAERFLYWPSVGACGALAWAFAPRGDASRRAYLRGALAGAAVLVLFAANTVERNRDFSIPLALWTKTAAQSPNNVNARMNLGKALFEAGRTEEAAEQFEAALKLSPDYVEGLNNLGAAYARLGRLEEAGRNFQRVTLIQPDHAEGWFNLGYLLYKQGNLPGAEKVFNQARAVDPQNPKTTYLLGVVVYKMGKLDEAESYWRETLRLDPGFTKASNNLSALQRARKGP